MMELYLFGRQRHEPIIYIQNQLPVWTQILAKSHIILPQKGELPNYWHTGGKHSTGSKSLRSRFEVGSKRVCSSFVFLRNDNETASNEAQLWYNSCNKMRGTVFQHEK